MAKRLRVSHPACPLADSNLLHLFLAWRDRAFYLTRKRLRTRPLPEDVDERGRRIRRAKVFFDACLIEYGGCIDLPSLTAFHAASVLTAENDIDAIFNSRDWNILPILPSDARSAGELAASVAKLGEVDDEYPILAAMAKRLGRAIATMNPKKYKTIVREWPDLVIIDLTTFMFTALPKI